MSWSIFGPFPDHMVYGIGMSQTSSDSYLFNTFGIRFAIEIHRYACIKNFKVSCAKFNTFEIGTNRRLNSKILLLLY